MDDYNLTDAELQLIWDTELARLANRATASPDPMAVIIGAQPGAGKSHAHPLIANQYPERTFLTVDSDKLRRSHPAFEQIITTDLLRMPVLTNAAAAAWTRMQIDQALTHRLDVLVENSFHTPELVTRQAAQFHQAGYRVHVMVLAVPGHNSRLDMVGRFLSNYHDQGFARWTNLASHTAGYNGTPQALTALEQSPAVAAMTVIDRAETALYDNFRRSDGQWTYPTGASLALNIGRTTPPTERAMENWLDEYGSHRVQIHRLHLDPTATQPVMDALQQDAISITRTLDQRRDTDRNFGPDLHR